MFIGCPIDPVGMCRYLVFAISIFSLLTYKLDFVFGNYSFNDSIKVNQK